MGADQSARRHVEHAHSMGIARAEHRTDHDLAAAGTHAQSEAVRVDIRTDTHMGMDTHTARDTERREHLRASNT